MAIKQPRDHLKRLPTIAELKRAGVVDSQTPEPGEATSEHPLLTASRPLDDQTPQTLKPEPEPEPEPDDIATGATMVTIVTDAPAEVPATAETSESDESDEPDAAPDAEPTEEIAG